MNISLICTIATTIVNVIVSIVGFLITYKSMRKNFENELRKQKSNIALEKMSVIPYEVINLMSEMISSGKNKQPFDDVTAHFNNIMNTIYSYGSAEAIKIASLMQSENYLCNQTDNKLNEYRAISFYVILASQIKYDVTGIAVSSGFWFQMRITDYTANKENIKIENNKIVNELNLNENFKIN